MTAGPPPDPQPSAPAPARRRWWRLAARAAFALVAVALLVHAASTPAEKYGDGWEYTYQLEALARHGTPDLRDEDLAAANARFTQWTWHGFPDHQSVSTAQHRQAANGKWYGIHFWGYALTCVPAKFALREAGEDELAAMKVTNAAWYLAGVAAALFGLSGSVFRRVVFAGLVSAGPVFWYVQWTGAEIYSWSLAVMAVVALDTRRYGLAAALAGLGAMQNPPLVCLAGAAILAALWRREWRSAAAGVLGTGLAFVPALFCYAHFGKPSLIEKEATRVSAISYGRTWGLAIDLNQGLLPYVPLLLVGAAIGAAVLLYRRNATAVALLLALAGMGVAVQLQVNWNAGCLGMMRYLVWMTPVLGWLAVEGIWGRLAGRVLLAVAVAGQIALAAYGPPAKDSHVFHSPLARWVMDNAPTLYAPVPEVFVERVTHREMVDQEWTRPQTLPVAYVRDDGVVTKILIHPATVERVNERFRVDPEYMIELRQEAAGRSEWFYAHPPPGKVTANPEPPKDWWRDPPRP
jgi:hypothetical protein